MDEQSGSWILGLLGLIAGAGIAFVIQSARASSLRAENAELKKKLESSDKAKKIFETKIADFKKQIEAKEGAHKAAKDNLEKIIHTSRVEKETAVAEAELHSDASKKLRSENKTLKTRTVALEKDLVEQRARLEEETSSREKQTKDSVEGELKKLKSHYEPLVKQLREEVLQHEKREKIRKEASSKQIQEQTEEISSLKRELATLRTSHDESKKTHEKSLSKAMESVAESKKGEASARLEAKTQVGNMQAVQREYQDYKQKSSQKMDAMKKEHELIQLKVSELSAKLAEYDPKKEAALQEKIQTLSQELGELKSSHQSLLETQKSDREALLSDIKNKEQDLMELSKTLAQKCLELEKIQNHQIDTNAMLSKVTKLLAEKRETSSYQNGQHIHLENGHNHHKAAVSGISTLNNSAPVKSANGIYTPEVEQQIVEAALLASTVDVIYKRIVLETSADSRSTVEMYRDIVKNICDPAWQK